MKVRINKGKITIIIIITITIAHLTTGKVKSKKMVRWYCVNKRGQENYDISIKILTNIA
jgi:hypothetical protein